MSTIGLVHSINASHFAKQRRRLSSGAASVAVPLARRVAGARRRRAHSSFGTLPRRIAVERSGRTVSTEPAARRLHSPPDFLIRSPSRLSPDRFCAWVRPAVRDRPAANLRDSQLGPAVLAQRRRPLGGPRLERIRHGGLRRRRAAQIRLILAPDLHQKSKTAHSKSFRTVTICVRGEATGPIPSTRRPNRSTCRCGSATARASSSTSARAV